MENIGFHYLIEGNKDAYLLDDGWTIRKIHKQPNIPRQFIETTKPLLDRFDEDNVVPEVSLYMFYWEPEQVFELQKQYLKVNDYAFMTLVLIPQYIEIFKKLGDTEMTKAMEQIGNQIIKYWKSIVDRDFHRILRKLAKGKRDDAIAMFRKLSKKKQAQYVETIETYVEPQFHVSLEFQPPPRPEDRAYLDEFVLKRQTDMSQMIEQYVIVKEILTNPYKKNMDLYGESMMTLIYMNTQRIKNHYVALRRLVVENPVIEGLNEEQLFELQKILTEEKAIEPLKRVTRAICQLK